jgi:hypothetical protein
MTTRKLPRRLRIGWPFASARPAASGGPVHVALPLGPRHPVGLGDVVKQVTSAVGIKPCSGCQRRAEALNRIVTFQGRTGPKRPPR